MFDFLFDRLGLILFLLGTIALCCGLLWWRNRERPYLIATLACVGLFALLLGVRPFVVTQRQRVVADLRALAEAAENGRKDELLRRLAPDFAYRTMKREEVVERGIRSIRQTGVNEIYLWGIRVESLSQAEGKAQVWFGATVRSGGVDMFVARCRAHYGRYGEDWKMKSIEAFNPVANQDQPIEIPFR